MGWFYSGWSPFPPPCPCAQGQGWPLRGLAEFWAGNGGVLGGFSQGACHRRQDPGVSETTNLEEFLIKLNAVKAAFLSCDNTDCFASETSFSVLLILFLAYFSHARLHCVVIIWVLIEYSCMRACTRCLFSRVRLFATLWTVLHQAPLSMGFLRQEYWNELPCPPPGDLSDPGIEPVSLVSPTLTGGFFTTSTTWEAQKHH